MATPINLSSPAAPQAYQPQPSRTSGALVLNINAPLSNYAGDGAVSAPPAANQAPAAAPGTTVSPAGDSFQKTKPAASFSPNPFASPEQQLQEAYQAALNARNDAENIRNSYLNLANNLNGQAFQNKLSPQPSALQPQPFGQNAFQAPAPTTPDPQVAQLQQQLLMQQQLFQNQLQELQQTQQKQQLMQMQQQQEAAQKAAMEAQQQAMQQQVREQQALQQQMLAQQQAAQQMDPMMQQMQQPGMQQPQMQQPFDPMQQYQPNGAPPAYNPYDPNAAAQQAYNPYDPNSMQQQAYNPYDPAQQQMMPQQQPQGLTAAPLSDLNNMMEQGTPEDNLAAINEVALRQQGDLRTYELLKRTASVPDPRLQPNEANLKRQAALFALGNLDGSPVNANVPTNVLPGMESIRKIINSRSEDPAVKAAAVTALGYINRPQDPTIQKRLKEAAKDKNPDVKNAVDQVRAGMMSPAAQAPAGAGQLPAYNPNDPMNGMLPAYDPAQQQQMGAYKQGFPGMPMMQQALPQGAVMA